MKIGISVKIDVTKIDKTRLYKGKKGTYLNLTTFVDTEDVDQYGNNGFISQTVSKEERNNNIRTPILGNCAVFYKQESQQRGGYQPQQNQQPPDDDIPF
ncbi:MAG: hypothetical protein U9N77_00110 [Thermodesulfobacteriota bacterium]|nr:hypothetical protein [Thermodesulfobacteriota bacterium]